LTLLRCQDRLIGEDRLKTENLGVKKEEKVGQNVTFMPTAPAHSVKITIPPTARLQNLPSPNSPADMLTDLPAESLQIAPNRKKERT
jgi:hypothetical protein